MKLRCKHGPHFLKRELGFLISFASAITVLLGFAGFADSSVIKMPKPLPDIVKSYRSVKSPPVRPALQDTYVKVSKGDYVTILAKGEIIIGGNIYGPKTILVYQLGEKASVRKYNGPELIEVPENGGFYLGYEGLPPQVGVNTVITGSFDVDIIVWKTKDPNLIAKFLDEASLAQPKDKELKEMAQEFKKRQEVLIGLQEKTNEVEEIKKELSALEGKEVSGIKKATKQELRDSTSPVVKMPQPLPFIVKSYKSVFVDAGRPDMKNSGVQVKQGDYITILAKGTINLGSATLGDKMPKDLLSYKLSEKDFERRYTGPELIEIRETGSIYLSYGERHILPPSFHKGLFYVDIIVWKTNDPKLVARFLEEASLSQPKDKDLKEMAQEFKKRQEVSLALQKKTEGVGEVKPVITPPMKEQVPEAKKPETKEQIPEQKVAKRVEEKPLLAPRDKEIDKAKGTTTEKQVSTVVQKPREEKKTITPLKEKETSQITEGDEGKKIEELSEKLKKALQAMKELEDMKEVLARLESMEVEKSKQPKNLPVIAIANPRDGMSVDSEYVSLFGVAEHEKGILKFEILVNGKPVGLKDRRDLQLVPKDRKRIEFSERIQLREGQNTISIAVQGTEGLTNQKTISIQLAKKREEVYAVVIGINKYKNLPSLKYAVNDAREFYRYLVEVNQVPKDHIWLLLDEEATLEKMKNTLGTLLRRSAGKDDTVIIFLAGHGATEKDASSPDGDGLEKYILPYNADPKDLYSTAMPMSEVARIFQRISSERLVFIADTCYSGASGGRTILAGETRTNVSGAFLERLSQGKGRVILTASDANEVSFEKDELKHGVFTYYLLEGLRGKADLDGDGVITLDEIYRYVSKKVPQATGQDQHPVRKGETTGQIVLGVVK